jgi:predicted Zn-dependent protease with MMP-like domain
LLKQLAQTEVRATLGSLPKLLRAEAEQLPVTYEHRPNQALLDDGVEPDTLGLFVGLPFEEGALSGGSVPAQIILFLDNLWEMAEDDEEIFREEVRTTLLHELGHYLGLDEDDLTDRGLE